MGRQPLPEIPGIVVIGDGLREAEKWIPLMMLAKVTQSPEMALHLVSVMMLNTLAMINQIEHAYRCPADHS